jgi:hypothetical protein
VAGGRHGGKNSRAGRDWIVFSFQFSVFSFQFSVFSFQFSVLSFQFSVFSFQFSVLSSQFSVLSSQFSVLSSQFAVRSSQFAVRSSQFSVLSSQFAVEGLCVCCTQITHRRLLCRNNDEHTTVVRAFLTPRTKGSPSIPARPHHLKTLVISRVTRSSCPG